MGQLMGVKTPPKSQGVLCFKVRYLKTTTSTGVPFGKFPMDRKSHHLMERVYTHLSINGCRKSGALADPELTVTLFLEVYLCKSFDCERLWRGDYMNQNINYVAFSIKRSNAHFA
jgi:hypothetical protein